MKSNQTKNTANTPVVLNKEATKQVKLFFEDIPLTSKHPATGENINTFVKKERLNRLSRPRH